MIDKKVLIAGGGIGGTSAALSLAKLGFEVEVFEQAPSFAEIGAGIQLSPNCTRVLFDVGLEEALRSVAFVPEGVEMRHWSSGRLLNSSALGDSAVQSFGYPYFHVHRADLMQVLVAAANNEERIVLRENALVTDVSQDKDGVTLQIDGEAGDEIHRGDILVGADGINSVVRASLFGAQAPKFTGNVAWRALVKADQLPSEMVRPMATAWWGPHKHFVHYYVRSGELVNCVCVVEKKGWEVESWTERGEYSELKKDFTGWHEQIQTLIDYADRDSLYKWALYDRPPMSKWGEARVTLLGDACHPTLPFMAQGAAMAIEDGAVLAHCLSLPGEDAAAKLQHYEDLRRDRTAGVQLGSRRNAKVFHLSGIAAWLRNRAVKRAAGNSMRKLYQYNALEVAKPPRL
jgi:salicylate hydroxylase